MPSIVMPSEERKVIDKVNYYFDYNFDGIADEVTDEANNAAAKELLSALYYLAENNYSNIPVNENTPSERVLASKILNAMKANNYPPYNLL